MTKRGARQREHYATGTRRRDGARGPGAQRLLPDLAARRLQVSWDADQPRLLAHPVRA